MNWFNISCAVLSLGLFWLLAFGWVRLGAERLFLKNLKIDRSADRFKRDNASGLSLNIFLEVGLYLFATGVFAISTVFFFARMTGSLRMALGAYILIGLIGWGIDFKQAWAVFLNLAKKISSHPVVLIIFIALGILPVIHFSHYMPDQVIQTNALAFFGILHATKYANIATFMSLSDTVPVLGQNYAQSLIASVTMVLGNQSPWLALAMLLVIAQVSLQILTFGLFQSFGISKGKSFFWMLVVLLGNTALSLSHILVIDSGSPFLLNGYFDSLYLVGSGVLFLFWLNCVELKSTKSIILTSLSAYFLFQTWHLVGAQMYGVAGMVIALKFLSQAKTVPLAKWVQTNIELVKKVSVFVLPLVFLFFVSVRWGGMLTSKKLLDKPKVPGVAVAGVVSDTKLHFGIPYFYGFAGWKPGLGGVYRSPVEDLPEPSALVVPKKWSQWSGIFEKFIHKLDHKIFDAFYVMFFPILGLCLLLIHRKSLLEKYGSVATKLLWVGGLAFFPNLLLVFSIQMSGLKWELSRFLIFGIYVGMLAFSLGTEHFLSKLQGSCRWIRKPIFTSIAFYCLFGVLINTLGTLRIHGNLKGKEVWRKFQVLSRLTPGPWVQKLDLDN